MMRNAANTILGGIIEMVSFSLEMMDWMLNSESSKWHPDRRRISAPRGGCLSPRRCAKPGLDVVRGRNEEEGGDLRDVAAVLDQAVGDGLSGPSRRSWDDPRIEVGRLVGWSANSLSISSNALEDSVTRKIAA